MKTVPGAMTALLVPRLDEPLHLRISAGETLLHQPITGARLARVLFLYFGLMTAPSRYFANNTLFKIPSKPTLLRLC
jgi:hypothetical protein